MLLKVQNIVNICPSELINRLVIITDHAEVLIFVRQQTNQLELCRIGILILVHHDIAQTFLIRIQDFAIKLKKLHCFHDQIIKIQRIVLPEHLLIFTINLCLNTLRIISCCACFKLDWIDQFILCRRNN